ncbi:sigma-70 family RNA polymerase sigma factor [Stieleria sp. ICT_E10.1]|uniref:sigma-70 family RNA polymerase sigma factor n=1 Tax=Stieleria sedimenti TaxID=2976331 RepID=UPI00217FB676|nr:sigma-70 family RNA polymerase sigma factor [Stieleria sedimenti]MCS7469196.1 sigma-70 family RNA polymerase sigma factor [Stieleria sedimenti]
MDQPENEEKNELELALERYRPVLVTLAEAMISPAYRGDIEASDLVQQTLLEAHTGASVLEPLDDGPFFGWLRKSLQNNMLDAVKHLKTQKCDVSRRVRESELEESFARLEQVLAGDETSPSRLASRNEQIATMLSSLQELPDNQRRAVIMKHLQGFSLKEVAASLGLSEPATAGLLHRGRQNLIRRMGKCDE